MSKQKGFEHVCRQRNLKENRIVVDLRESEKLIGQLYPVLVDEKGNILDGQHRLKANPNWRKEIIKGIDSERKKAMIRLHANWHRRKVYPEQVLKELAKITGWKGAAPYAAFLGCSVRTIQRYLPQQYKLRMRRTAKEMLQLPYTLELESKRQLSLREKDMQPYEIELRNKFLEEQLHEERKQAKEHVKHFKTISEWEKEHLKKVKLHNYFYHMSDDDIFSYMAKINSKAKVRVEKVANNILQQRKEYRERENRTAIFKEKIEELYAKFKQITVEFTDGTTLPLNVNNLPSPILGIYDKTGNRELRQGEKGYREDYIKTVIIRALVTDLLGFDKFGYPLER